MMSRSNTPPYSDEVRLHEKLVALAREYSDSPFSLDLQATIIAAANMAIENVADWVEDVESKWLAECIRERVIKGDSMTDRVREALAELHTAITNSPLVAHFDGDEALHRAYTNALAALSAPPQEPVAWADKIAFESAMKAGKGCDVWPSPGEGYGRELVALCYAHPPAAQEPTSMDYGQHDVAPEPAQAAPADDLDCGEAGHDEGRCGNANCTPPAAPAEVVSTAPNTMAAMRKDVRAGLPFDVFPPAAPTIRVGPTATGFTLDEPAQAAPSLQQKLSAASAEGGSDMDYEPPQEPVVPAYRGYAALGTGQYCINHSRVGELPELVITLATENDKRGRQIGESRDNPPDAPPIQADEMIIRITFTSERGLFALEDQLAMVRRVHFPSTGGSSTPCESPVPCTEARLTCPSAVTPGDERSDGQPKNRSHSATAAHPPAAQDKARALGPHCAHCDDTGCPECDPEWAQHQKPAPDPFATDRKAAPEPAQAAPSHTHAPGDIMCRQCDYEQSNAQAAPDVLREYTPEQVSICDPCLTWTPHKFAADELARLRAELAEAQDLLDHAHDQRGINELRAINAERERDEAQRSGVTHANYWMDRAERAEAERDALRAALSKIINSERTPTIVRLMARDGFNAARGKK